MRYTIYFSKKDSQDLFYTNNDLLINIIKKLKDEIVHAEMLELEIFDLQLISELLQHKICTITDRLSGKEYIVKLQGSKQS